MSPAAEVLEAGDDVHDLLPLELPAAAVLDTTVGRSIVPAAGSTLNAHPNGHEFYIRVQ